MTLRRLGWLALLAVLISPQLSPAESVTDQRPATEESFSNPIIAGFAPDPSIVRVGDDFWLINSTFEYFPGIPIYHSRDLVDWELVNYALTRPSQADLSSIKSSDGIHASTIRYHDGTYYIITTNNIDGRMVNFVVTADDPRGEWSEARVLEGAPGIDPSLGRQKSGCRKSTSMQCSSPESATTCGVVVAAVCGRKARTSTSVTATTT